MIEQLEELFRRQARIWPQFAQGIEGLARARTRRVRIDWFEVWLRHIPHRVTSTTAPVDRESIARRRCFLCADNLPPQEEGVRFDHDFTIYCNPYPIVERHLTITHREHRAQAIAGHFGAMLDLAAVLPGYFVIYNGPECGASAPDHMHFQAGSRALFPIEGDTAALASSLRGQGAVIAAVPNYARNVLLLAGRDRPALLALMDRALDLLAQATAKEPEPMVNVAVFHERGDWMVYLFARGKHRPEVFYSGELTVSPASIDLCGIFVVPLAADFEKISAEHVATIFREVTLPDDQFQQIAAKLESNP